MAMKRAGLTLSQTERLSAGRKVDLARLIAAQLQSLDERQREIGAAPRLLTSVLSRLDRSEPIDVATFCSLIQQGETLVSQVEWFAKTASHMTEPQRAAMEKAKAALPAGFDSRRGWRSFGI